MGRSFRLIDNGLLILLYMGGGSFHWPSRL
nr:MAG TPA: adenylate cyclase-like protein [Caudoviricetes sp.]